MMFLFVLLLGFATDNDAFASRNSHCRFASRRPASPSRHYRVQSNCATKTILFSENSGHQDNTNTDAELFLLEYSIDSFLRGDYDRTFSEEAASPLPGLSPSDTVDAALRSLRDLDEPEPSHGAAVFLRFCAELGRGERWGTTSTSSWTELLRGALTPTMLARRIRASEEYSSLLDWTRLEVAPFGGSSDTTTSILKNGNVESIDAVLFFDETKVSPEIYRFELAKMLGGVWLIQSVQKQKPSIDVAAKQEAVLRRPKKQPTRKKRQDGKPSQRQSRQQRGKPRGGKGKPKLGDNKDEGGTDKKTTK